jgi:DNA-binding MarR family transcriptional regulator
VPFTLEDDFGFLLARTHRAMRRWLATRLAPLNITYEQFKVINALCEEEDLSQTDLADRADMDKTSLARMLDRMQRAQLIRRREDPDDCRINRITLTAEGRRLALQVMPHRDLGLRQATEGMTAQEVGHLKRMLNLVYRNMSSWTARACESAGRPTQQADKE